MSESQPPKKQHTKPYYKIRPGFSEDELAEFHTFLSKFDLNPGKFTRRVILQEIRTKTLADSTTEVP